MTKTKQSELDKIKQIAEQMLDGPEKQTALQAYSNLKTFEVVASSVEEAAKKCARTGNHRDLQRYLKVRRNDR